MKLSNFFKVAVILLVLATLFNISAAKKSKSPKTKLCTCPCPSPTPNCPTPTLKWNIMVYIMGNNDLSCESFDSVAQIASVAKITNNYQFVVFWARSSRSYECGNTVFMGVKSWAGTVRAFHVLNTNLTEIKNFGNINSADPASVTNFVKVAADFSPADNYIFLFWGHGGGTIFGVDQSHTPSSLFTVSLVGALQNGLTLAKLKQFEVVGFDASLMGSEEVLVSFNGVARYLIASPELAPGEWDWSSFGILTTKSVGSSNSDAAREQLGKSIVDGYFKINSNASTIALAFSDLNKNLDLNAALNKLGAALRVTLSNTDAVSFLWNARYFVLEYGNTIDPNSGTGTIDLTNFANLLLKYPSADVRTAAKDIITLIANQIVKYERSGGEAAIGKGLSVFFPGVNNLFQQYSNYYAVSFPFNTEWYTFLKAYFAINPANIAFLSSTAKGSAKSKDLPKYEITTKLSPFDDSKIIYASMSLGLVLNSATPNLVYLQATLRETLTTTSIISDWDGSLYLLRADTDPNKKYEFVHVTESASGADILELPLLFTEPDGKDLIVISFADALHQSGTKGQQSGDLSLVDYFVYDFTAPYNTGTYSLVTGSTMYPLFQVYNLTSSNYLNQFIFLTNNVVPIKNTTRMKLTPYHWTRPNLSPITSFDKVYFLQEATDSNGITTVSLFRTDLSSPTTVTEIGGQTIIDAPSRRPTPSKSRKVSASKKAVSKSRSKKAVSKSRSRKAVSKSRSHSKKAGGQSIAIKKSPAA